jgi:hypothetical protein
LPLDAVNVRRTKRIGVPVSGTDVNWPLPDSVAGVVHVVPSVLV